jgi:hypothetical protein
MKDQDDAPPTRTGQAVTPEPGKYIAGGLGPDGAFFLDCPEDEMVGRGLMNFLMHELDRYYVNKRMKAMLDKAQQEQVLNGMMRGEKKKIDKRIVLG